MSRPPWVDGYRKAASAPAQRVEVVDQLFPTPPELAARMVELANIKPGHRVLEPSAGTGNLLRAIRAVDTKGPDDRWSVGIVAVEVNRLLAHRLADYTCVVHGADFLTLDIAALGMFDRVVMNSPFGHGQDIQHIQHAIRFLVPGGRLVALCAAGSRQQRVLVPLASLVEWVEDAFKSVGTGVRVSLLVIDRVA